MKDIVKNLEDSYKIAIVLPVMIGLGVIVLCGLFVFALDQKNNKRS